MTLRLRGAHVNHKRIARGAALTAIFVIVAKLIVAVREVAIAWRYGVSGIVDGYQLAYTLATWVPLMAVSVAGVVLVPKLVELRAETERRSAFISELNGIALVLGAFLMILSFLLAPAMVKWLGAGLPNEVQTVCTQMLRGLAPVALMTVIAGCFAIRLQARESYAFALTEAAPALAIIIFVVAASGATSWSPLVYGAVVGFMVQTLVLALMTRHVDGGVGGLRGHSGSGVWRGLLRSMSFMALGQLVLNISLPLDQAFAGRLQEGSIAVLGYASRLIGLGTGLGAVVIARALLPTLSQVAASGNLTLGASQVRRWSWLMLGAGAGVAVVGWPLAQLLVAVVFERGAFSSDDVEAVSTALRYGLLQIPFYLGGVALVQWFAATGRFSILLYVAMFAIGVKFALLYFLHEKYGVVGIMISSAAMYAVSYILQLIFVETGYARRR